MDKRLSKRAFFLVGIVIVLIAATTFVATQVNAQNQYAADIAGRLKQRGVPVKYVTTISRMPYTIEIALQSSSDGDYTLMEDNWFSILADREATLAYRVDTRLDSYILAVYNTQGKLIYSGQTYLYPEDLNQQLFSPESSKVDDSKAEEIVAGELQLAGLRLDSLEVAPENAMGSNGQVLSIQVSAKDVEAINRALPGFLDSLFSTLETVNAEHGTYIVLCHLTVLDDAGNVLMDYVRDLEIGHIRWKSVQGLYSGWYPQPVETEPVSSQPTSATPSGAYPPPLDSSSSLDSDLLSSTPYPYP